jgi:hypothetical protein
VEQTTENSFALWDTTEENCSGVGYNGKKPSALLDTTEENSSENLLKLLCGVSHTGGKPLPLYPIPEKHK